VPTYGACAIINLNIFFSLIYNAALLLSVGLFYDLFCRGKQASSTRIIQLIFGLIIGGVTIVLMATPAHWAPGIIFDTRSILLSLVGLFFGYVPTLTAMAIGVGYRLHLGGGGTLVGVATIVSSGLIGLTWRHYRFRASKELSLFEMYLFGFIVHAAMLLCLLLLPHDAMQRTIKALFFPIILIYPACTVLLGNLFISRLRRHRTEANLRVSEKRNQTILQTAMNGFWRFDMQGRLLEVNDAYCRMSGYDSQDLLSMSISDIEVNQTAEDVADHIQMTVEQGKLSFESQHRGKDGAVFDVEVSVQCLDVEERQCVAFIRDITERKRADQALQASRKQYMDLVEGTSDLITRVDQEGRLVFVNHAANEIYGLAERDCIGRLAFDFIHPDDRVMTMAAFTDWLKSDKSVFRHENRQVSINGQVHLMAWSIRAEYDDAGQVSGFAGTARDVTEKRRAEKERANLENQLLQAQKMESIGQLAGGVAHDFNNMLSVILGHAELALMKSEPSQPIAVSLKEICKAAIHSSELTRQLLTFARKQTISPKVLDLNELVTGMLKMLQRLIGENIHIAWYPSPKLWPVKIDPSQFDQILTNLCLNARDAISGTGTITIRTANDPGDLDSRLHPEFIPGDYMRLSVSDDGCGMDQETLARIFEPFFTTKEIGVGTGLGLATVMGAVKQNNGYIYVQSEPGQATTFDVYLPRVDATLDAEPERRKESIRRGSETILVVEDDPMVLQLITVMLEKGGYRVLAAETTDMAQSLAKEETGPIHLLISDVIMPVMNGKELSERLQILRPEMKVLFMSGYTADIISSHGVVQEGVHLLQKPITFEPLGNAVRDILDG
jgi:PAS domain S-box-containing protein